MRQVRPVVVECLENWQVEFLTACRDILGLRRVKMALPDLMGKVHEYHFNLLKRVRHLLKVPSSGHVYQPQIECCRALFGDRER